MVDKEMSPPAVKIETQEDAPVKRISSDDLRSLGQHLTKMFEQYRSDRRVAELKWLRNLRQYLGIYDPEVERELAPNRSKAYPKITRVKCISVLSRVMNLMFPGNERNWELRASPSPDMSPQDVQQAVMRMVQKMREAGADPQQMSITDEMIREAAQSLASERAEMLSELIDDQLQEIGGDQTQDYVSLNRRVVQSGILYGLGVLRGPLTRAQTSTQWVMEPLTQQPMPVEKTSYKPQFEVLPVWDFYPDMSAKDLRTMDGYFYRLVMSRAQVRALARRPDFFGDIIKEYLSRTTQGNYKAQEFETELRVMGVKINVNETKTESSKFEVLVWNGSLSGQYLQQAGVDVPDNKLADDLEAEVWLLDGHVIKADLNPWRKLGVEVRTIHAFLFDEDDTSPVGNGLPNVMRDSQMSISAATRMLLDNASIVCGPNLELNTDLLRPDQDLTSTAAYKIWYREGTGPEANLPAVRNISVDGHMPELLKTIDLFMRFSDMETFVGPATGGDMERGMAEPMRTAAGASMLRGDAALPFKDIIRNFDSFTQSIIYSLVQFNRKFNPDRAPEGDYNVIARGATSLIAKEVRGIQIDALANAMTETERMHVDERKFVEQRFAVRDLTNLLLPQDEVRRKQAAAQQQQQEIMAQQQEKIAAEIRKTLSDAFKNIAQGQKNSANADAVQVKAALDMLEKGIMGGSDQTTGAAATGEAAQRTPQLGGGAGNSQAPQLAIGGGQGLPPNMQPG